VKGPAQLSSPVLVPIIQRCLLFPDIPDTQMKVLLDLDLPV
jgi:hypothetical protein